VNVEFYGSRFVDIGVLEVEGIGLERRAVGADGPVLTSMVTPSSSDDIPSNCPVADSTS